MARSSSTLLLTPLLGLLLLASAANAATILSVATSQRLSILSGAIQLCPALAKAASNSSTAVTLFAPTDVAFATALASLSTSPSALLGNTDLVCSILEYHIVPTVIPSSAASTTAISVPTLLPGSSLTIQLVGGKVKVNNATVTSADVPAGASVIHIIDQLLLPPALFAETIASVVAKVPELSTLLGAVAACPSIFKAATDPTTAVTVFAPTNLAFAALASLGISAASVFGNQTLLCAVLEYHIVGSVIKAAAASTTAISVPTLLPLNSLTIQLVNGKVKVNNATVTSADVKAGASIVHIIDKVLLPPFLLPPTLPPPSLLPPSRLPPAPVTTTIASVVASKPDLKTLLAAVSACPPLLAAATSTSTAVTVFAPTDEAFATALASLKISAASLLANQTLLCAVLEYHIVGAVIKASAASTTAISVPTLLPNSNLTIQLVNGTVKVNNATVTTADVSAGASIVHIIDQVLLPPFLLPPAPTPATTIASVVASKPHLTTLLAAVSACPPLLAAATNASTAVTVFAPSDKAFATALASLNISAASLLANQTLLCTVLEYHIVGAVIKASAAKKTAISVPTLLPHNNLTIQLVNGKVKVNGAIVTTPNIKAGASIIHIIDEVLLPPSLTPTSTIASVASGVPALSTLLTLVKASPDILSAATDPSTVVTVWAPSNQAFADALPTLTKKLKINTTQLLGNSKLVTAILAYHISPRPLIHSTDFGAAPKTIPTLLNKSLVIRKSGSKYLVGAPLSPFTSNAATVQTPDVPAGKSVVHVINKVLLPLNWASIYGKLV